jgi:hypothetical protein
MPEPNEYESACVGCGAMNPIGAEACAGCGHRHAGLAPEPSPAIASKPIPPARTDLASFPVSSASSDEFDHLLGSPQEPSHFPRVSHVLVKVAVFLLGALAVGFCLLVALLIAFYISCGGPRINIGNGLTIAYAAIGIGIFGILSVGVKSFLEPKDSGKEKRS